MLLGFHIEGTRRKEREREKPDNQKIAYVVLQKISRFLWGGGEEEGEAGEASLLAAVSLSLSPSK